MSQEWVQEYTYQVIDEMSITSLKKLQVYKDFQKDNIDFAIKPLGSGFSIYRIGEEVLKSQSNHPQSTYKSKYPYKCKGNDKKKIVQKRREK